MPLDSERRSELLVQEGAVSSSESIKYWNLFVDAMSLVWIVAFSTSLLAYDARLITMDPAILYVTDAITIFAMPVFIADLMLKYHRSEHSKVFFKKHWLDILFVVPYFRMLRALSMVRIVGLVRLGKLPRSLGIVVKAARAVSRALKLSKK